MRLSHAQRFQPINAVCNFAESVESGSLRSWQLLNGGRWSDADDRNVSWMYMMVVLLIATTAGDGLVPPFFFGLTTILLMRLDGEEVLLDQFSS